MSKVKNTNQITIMASLCISILFMPCAMADMKPEVITVTAEQKTNKKSTLSPTYQHEQKKLQKIAGATNLIIPEQENRLSTLQDALDQQPGIVIQNFFGGTDQPRLNIRGSGA